MNFHDRRADICRRMKEAQLDLLIGVHDGAHFIEKPNAVMVLANFKSIGAAAVVMAPNGVSEVIVTPPWDAERAVAASFDAGVRGEHDVVDGILGALGPDAPKRKFIGIAGLRSMPWQDA